MRPKESDPRPEHQTVTPPREPIEKSGAESSPLEQSLAATEARLAQAQPEVQKPIGFRPWEISALINADVVARHADDAPFLWLLRDRAVTAPHYSLEDLARLDERVEAHIDGLRVAGDYGWRLSAKALDWEEPGEVFAAGVLALESKQADRLARVLDVACKRRELQRGLISAAGWTAFEPIRSLIDGWLISDSAALRRIAVATYAVNRRDPGASLLHLICDDDAEVRARALKAVAELARDDLLPVVLHARNDKDPDCRFFAAWTAARLRDRSGETIQSLRDVAETAGPHQERALAMAIRCLPLPEATSWLRQLWKNPEQLRLAVIGAGVAGDPALVGVLIEWMEIESVARLAGEAFSMITGADLKYLDLNQDPPENQREHEGEEESRTERFKVLDPDSELPHPAPEKVANWWRTNKYKFELCQRYLCGSKIEPDGLRKVLVEGKQRQRAAAAVELSLSQPAEQLFEVRARGTVQQRRFEAWTS